MQQEKDRATLHENLALLDRRLARETQKKRALFSEMAALVWQAEEGRHAAPAEQLRHGAQLVFPSHGVGRETASAPSASDRVAYIRAYLAQCEASGQPLCLRDLLPVEQPTDARIAYVHNPYTDEAYEIFAAVLPNPTVRYADSFREACDRVVTDEADFCILPYRNSSDRLSSFSALAAHFSLSVCLLCRVFHADGLDVTHFALYSRHPLPLPQEGELHLRTSFFCADTEALAAHITAAGLMGILLEEVTTAPYTDDRTGAMTVTLTAQPPHQMIIPWLAYLTAFADGCTCHGLYKEI